MPSIFEMFAPKEIAAYFETVASNRIPYLGQTLWPRQKKLGMDLSWIKGSNGLPVVLKPSAFDTKATLRDRIGVKRIETEMPFFRESMLIKEKDRQELNKLMGNANESYLQLILKNIYDDQITLLYGAEAQEERMRMQILTTGMLSIVANGVAYDYDYHMPDGNKMKVQTVWSDHEKAKPLSDIKAAQMQIENTTGTKPTRAVCDLTTWSHLLDNLAIRLDMNPLGGANVILTDTMLEQYLLAKIGIKVQVYSKKYIDEAGATKAYIPEGVFVLIPEGNLGYTWFGTTPEESDLMSGAPDVQVSIVNTGVAITSDKHVNPVNCETIVSMLCMPSFEAINKVAILDTQTAKTTSSEDGKGSEESENQ